VIRVPHLGLLAVVLLVAISGTPASTARSSSFGTSFYVDCDRGRDQRSGTDPGQAWRSLERGNRARLAPGDALLLRRGCSWVGPLNAFWRGTSSRPVRIGAYGRGARPRIENAPVAAVDIRGSNQIMEYLDVRFDPPPGDPNCANQPVGWRTGFSFSGAAHNTVRLSRASGFTAGVFLSRSSRNNRIVRNTLVGNTVMSVNTDNGGADDSGAWGVAVNGHGNEIAYNVFADNNAWCSYDFGNEGASVEIYGGRGNIIHHNRSYGDSTFSELGGSASAKAADNTFVRNLYVNTRHARSEFLTLRGAEDALGPTARTRVVNNSVYQTGRDSRGISCYAGCGAEILELRNNILWVDGQAMFGDGALVEASNIYWRTGGNPFVEFRNSRISPSSRVAAPLFRDPQRLDFRLLAGSPGIDAATRSAATGRFPFDLTWTSVPQGAGVDLGAYEFTPLLRR